MNTKNPLQGKWKVECQIITDDNRWEIYPQFCLGECVWAFQTDNAYAYTDPDEQTFRGKLTERFDDDITVAEYGYLAHACRLYVERPYFNDDGRMWSCHSDILSVEAGDADEFILYKLRNEKDEPRGNNYRLRLKKLA